MKDYSIGGFLVASAAEALAFFFVRDQVSALGRITPLVAVGWIAYLAYVGFRKSQDNEVLWMSGEIALGLFAASCAIWAPVLLVIFVGWTHGY